MRTRIQRRARLSRPKRHEEEGSGRDRWLVSYADFITLMFAFFLTMYAASSVDAQRMRAVVESLGEAFQPGSHPPGSPVVTVPGAPLMKPAGDGTEALATLEGRLRERLAEALKAKQVDIEMEKRGLVVSIKEAGSFATGSAELPDATQTLIGTLVDTIGGIDNPVRVEGHSDDTPIHTPRYANNWDLSTARATAVVAFILAHGGVPPEQLSASGYGEFHPRQPNTTPEGRARNRRVDLVILNTATESAEEPRAADTGR